MWLVRLGTFSRYGHAAEVVDVRSERPAAPGSRAEVLIVEAAPGGVRQRWVPVDEFRWSTGGPLDEYLTDAIRADLVARAYSTLNRGYDWPSIIRLAPRFFNNRFRGWSKDRPDRRLFCSELIAWNRREAAVKFARPALDMFPTLAPRDVMPGDLQDWCPPSPMGKP
jgi:hypothetical protein